MHATLPLLKRHFFQAFRRTLYTQQIINSKTHKFCTQSSHNTQETQFTNPSIDSSQSVIENKQEGARSLCGRIEKLARGDPVGFAFQSWMGDGFPVHRGDIFHTINRLRKNGFNKRALEVMQTTCLCKCLTEKV